MVEKPFCKYQIGEINRHPLSGKDNPYRKTLQGQVYNIEFVGEVHIKDK